MIQGIYTPNLVPFRTDRSIDEDEDIRGKIACILADCGFSEAASAGRRPGPSGDAPRSSRSGVDVEGLVREVITRLNSAATRSKG